MQPFFWRRTRRRTSTASAYPSTAAWRRAVSDQPAAAWIAPSATVVGEVTVGPESSIWYGAVARADSAPIGIGNGTNVQDNCVLHADPGFPLTIGNNTTLGHGAICHGAICHGAICHGATIGDGVLVGMGAVVMNGATIGDGSLIAAGAVILEGADIPPRSLVAGVPAKVIRPVSDTEAAALLDNARRYTALAQKYQVNESAHLEQPRSQPMGNSWPSQSSSSV
jgi:carbonic anhydrase/acetyltransferase-like protein (isoleucine patch superfamily)